MASGISVVSTPVGMAVDLIEDMKSGGKAIDFNPKTISMKVLEIINSPERNKIINSALARISECDTRVVANKILKEVYLPLLASN